MTYCWDLLISQGTPVYLRWIGRGVHRYIKILSRNQDREFTGHAIPRMRYNLNIHFLYPIKRRMPSTAMVIPSPIFYLTNQCGLRSSRQRTSDWLSNVSLGCFSLWMRPTWIASYRSPCLSLGPTILPSLWLFVQVQFWLFPSASGLNSTVQSCPCGLPDSRAHSQSSFFS